MGLLDNTSSLRYLVVRFVILRLEFPLRQLECHLPLQAPLLHQPAPRLRLMALRRALHLHQQVHQRVLRRA